MKTFADTGLNANILKSLDELGFETPTPIQAETIPLLLESKRDIVALAQTGTGKTAAFGLPTVHLTNLDQNNPQTLVLAPTRELCLQITRDLETFAKYMNGLHVVPIYGGAAYDKQLRELRRGAHIVVGTPGRTMDMVNRGKLKLENIKRVILDEADEMLTMGFKDELDAILDKVPKTKQTLLFSATMSKPILNISKNYMSNPVEVSVAKMNVGSKNVKHLCYMVHAKDRYEVLKRVADSNPDIYAIVFCRTRRETQEVANKLIRDGYSANAIHGDLSQGQRDDVMGKFRTKDIQILVATDVAARGVDVNNLTHVINFDLPDDNEVYTHRSGRTGRAGNKGISIAIIHTREVRKLFEIEKTSGIEFEEGKIPSGKDICKIQLHKLIDKIEQTEVDEDQIEPFLPAIYKQLEKLSREDLIKRFVSDEFNRFLEYYRYAREIEKPRVHQGGSRGGKRSGGTDRGGYNRRRRKNRGGSRSGGRSNNSGGGYKGGGNRDGGGFKKKDGGGNRNDRNRSGGGYKSNGKRNKGKGKKW